METTSETFNDLYRIIDLLGVLLNGVLGGKLARVKHFDAVGFCVLGLMSALGGGVVRDVMLQVGPPVAITDPFYLSTAIAGAGIAILFKLESRPARIVLFLADGTVLGCWAATGAAKTLDAGYGLMPALLMGLLTAVGGGMIRDITAGRVPQVFGGTPLYATPALASAVIMVAGWEVHHRITGMVCAIVVGLVFTAWSRHRGWQLPANPEWTITLTASQLRRMLSGRGRVTVRDTAERERSGATPDTPAKQETTQETQQEKPANPAWPDPTGEHAADPPTDPTGKPQTNPGANPGDASQTLPPVHPADQRKPPQPPENADGPRQ